MKMRGLFAVVAVAGLTMACQASEEDGADGGVGAGGEGSGGNGSLGGDPSGGGGNGNINTGAVCDQICAKEAAAACPNDDPATCAAECRGLATAYPATCQAAIGNFLNCVAAQTFTCDEDGEAAIEGVCQAEMIALGNCASSGTGGDPGTGGSVPPAGDCAAAVERLAACATSGGNCEAVGDPAALEEGLSGACSANEAAFVGLVNSAGSCGELIDTLSTASPDFCAACHGEGSDACGGGPGPGPDPEAEAACQAYGDNIAGCVVESCAPAGPYERGLSGQFVLGCLDAVASGEADLGQIQAVGGATCAQLAQGLPDLIEGEGPLAGLCGGTYIRDAASCDAWATEITTCLPADLGGAPELYRDPQFWALTCVIADDEQTDGIFMCVDAAADCNATLMCISG